MESAKTPIKPLLLCAFGITLASSQAATIVAGNVTTTLGPDFFFDAAVTGGGDATVNQPNSAAFIRSFGILNVGAGGSTINISGIGWASAANAAANDATSATVAISYLGLDGVFGGGDDVLIGTVTDNFTYAGIGSEYVWAFDAPISGAIDGLNNQFRIVVSPSNESAAGSMSFKTTSGTALSAVKLSAAGTSVAVIPEPSAAIIGGVGLLALLRRRRA